MTGAEDTEMSTLERRYRTVLRLLPAGYRARWQDEMAETFLQSVITGDADRDEFQRDFGRPAWGEVFSVATLALRLRLGAAGAGTRSALVGAGVRGFALVGLLSYAVWATVGFGYGLWSLNRLGQSPNSYALVWLPLSERSMAIVGLLLSLVWLPAFLSVVVGRTRVARRFAVFALVADALTVVTTWLSEPVSPSAWSRLLIAALVVAALAGFHADAEPPRPRPWLIAYGSGVALAATLLGLIVAGAMPIVLDIRGVDTAAVLVAVAIHLTIVATGGLTPARTAWSLTLCLVALAQFALRATVVEAYAWMADGPERTSLLVTGLIEVGLLVPAMLGLAVLASYGLRRTPAEPRYGPVPAGGDPAR